MTKILSTIAFRANLLYRCKNHIDNAKDIISRWSKLSTATKAISLELELSELLLSARLSGLVTAVEILLNDTLADVFIAYPPKLGKKQISIQDFNASGSFLQTIKRISTIVVNELSYSSFKDYLAECQKLVTPLHGITEDQILTFAEIKATRDLYVHSNGKLNEIYERKAGEKARKPDKGKIPLDEFYIDTASTLAGEIVCAIETEISSSYAHCTKEAVFHEMWDATCCGKLLAFDKQWEVTTQPYHKKDFNWPWSSSEKALFDVFLRIFCGKSDEIETDIEYALYRWRADTAEGMVIRSWLESPFYI
jgi:hypothetical protein